MTAKELYKACRMAIDEDVDLAKNLLESLYILIPAETNPPVHEPWCDHNCDCGANFVDWPRPSPPRPADEPPAKCTCQPLAQQLGVPFGLTAVAVDPECPVHREPEVPPRCEHKRTGQHPSIHIYCLDCNETL